MSLHESDPGREEMQLAANIHEPRMRPVGELYDRGRMVTVTLTRMRDWNREHSIFFYAGVPRHTVLPFSQDWTSTLGMSSR